MIPLTDWKMFLCFVALPHLPLNECSMIHFTFSCSDMSFPSDSQWKSERGEPVLLAYIPSFFLFGKRKEV